MRFPITIGKAVLCGWSCVAAVGQNSAQQLGYGPNDKLLIVHADDAGMCHSVNVATIEALQRGLVRSASIMVPCPWMPEIAAYAREHPGADFGLHLTLTSEWKYYRWRPVASPEQVKGLLDAEGYLWRSERDTAQHATAQEVETELRAQIERARAFGIKPTHLDTHMGTVYTRRDFFDVYTKLGREYHVPVMVMRPTPEAVAYGKASGSPITEDVLRQVQAEGFPMLDYLVTGVEGNTLAARKQAYHELFQHLKPGVTMLIVHLGLDNDELKAVTGSWPQRHADYQTFTAPETQAWLDELGIKLTTWRELGRLGWRGQPPRNR